MSVLSEYQMQNLINPNRVNGYERNDSFRGRINFIRDYPLGDIVSIDEEFEEQRPPYKLWL